MTEFKLRCEVCGKAFIAHNPRKKRCSEACDAAAKERQAAEYRGSKKKAKEEKRRPRRLIDGVSASVRAKVKEAMRLGVSYGQLAAIKARELAAKERQGAKGQKKTARAATRTARVDDFGSSSFLL